MKRQTLTKKQINELLDQNPLHEILNVKKTNLTPKQIRFCEERARGNTKADSYRKAYNTKAKASTIANNGYKMDKRTDIQTMTQAISNALEFEKLHTFAQIRALVVERLTKEAISEESNPSVRVNALKALGTISGVDAFIHRSETKVIKDSDKAKEDLLNLIKDSLAMKTIDESDDDVSELLNEINGLATPPEILPSVIEGPHPHELEVGVPIQDLHSIPDIQSPSKSNSHNTTETDSEVNENNVEQNQ
jgi:hypothetical protein